MIPIQLLEDLVRKNSIHKQPQDWKDIIHNIKLLCGYSPRLESLCYRFAARAEDLSYGRNRAIFIFKNYVVKIPMNSDGFTDNDWEGSIEHPIYARTRLIYVEEIPVLFMERVEDVRFDTIKKRLGEIPNWVDGIDCGQVGFTKDGRLVAYDYGIR